MATITNAATITYQYNGVQHTTTAFAVFERVDNMPCKPVCKLCPKLVISSAVTFAAGVLTINLPAGAYNDDTKYCIIVAQAIPTSTTINAPVVFTIGTGTQTYPLVKCDCAQVTACGIRTRTKYSVVVSTNATGGVFKMLGKPCCAPNNDLRSVNGTAPVAVAEVSEAKAGVK